MKRIATAIVLCLVTAATASAQLRGQVTSPGPGVLCDKKAGFCADDQGISMGYTKEYLGEAAQNKLLAMGEFDMTTFVLSNGVSCDTKAKTCTVSKINKSVDAAHTKALFGEPVPSAGPVGPGPVIFSPEAGTLCDRKVGICADDQGISMALTEMHLGKQAQARQMALQKQNKLTPTYFVLSDGAMCNTQDKKCYVRDGSNQVHQKYTGMLFGN